MRGETHFSRGLLGLLSKSIGEIMRKEHPICHNCKKRRAGRWRPFKNEERWECNHCAGIHARAKEQYRGDGGIELPRICRRIQERILEKNGGLWR